MVCRSSPVKVSWLSKGRELNSGGSNRTFKMHNFNFFSLDNFSIHCKSQVGIIFEGCPFSELSNKSNSTKLLRFERLGTIWNDWDFRCKMIKLSGSPAILESHHNLLCFMFGGDEACR